MRLTAYARLGRISNLPTVWSNVVAGAGIAAAGSSRPATAVPLLLLGLSLSLFYTGGMFLNDAFDRHVDARERPERPIPSGMVSALEVFAVGGAQLAVAMALLALAAHRACGGGARPLVAGALLAGAIVLYDAWHKKNPLGPLVMGICRALVYVVTALAVADRLRPSVVASAALLLAYVVGLTSLAKWEARLRGARLPSVGALIAGISLLDALLLLVAGAPGYAAIAALGCPLTLRLQRLVRGT